MDHQTPVLFAKLRIRLLLVFVCDDRVKSFGCGTAQFMNDNAIFDK